MRGIEHIVSTVPVKDKDLSLYGPQGFMTSPTGLVTLKTKFFRENVLSFLYYSCSLCP